MKKCVLILCTIVAGLSLTSCGDAEGPTYEGTLRTGYNTLADPVFYSYSGAQKDEAATLLEDFMTDESRHYWEWEEYIAEFKTYEEMEALQKKFEKECVARYKSQLELLKKENIDAIFLPATDSCVFTAGFKMTLNGGFAEDCDTIFTVQRPILDDSSWYRYGETGESDIQRVVYLDDSNLTFETVSGQVRQYAYTRTGSRVDVYDTDEDGKQIKINEIRVTKITDFILYDETGKIKQGDFKLATLTSENQE